MAADGTIRIDTKLDNSGLTSGLNMLGTLAKRGAQTAVAAIGAVSTAMAGVATYAVKVGTSFEAGMSEVAAISGATATELEKLTEKAKEMGAKTKFSATESAAAFKYMAMAGWETADMLDGIEGIMNLAAASGEELAGVSDIVTDALTAFGLQAKDSAHFADVLAQASSRSNTNVGLMGYTFKYVAPVAGALGYSIEDVAVAIGLMANAGIKGEQAGTQLRGVLSRMSLPTEKVQTAMDKLGLSLTDSEGNMKSFAEVVQDMRTGFSQLTDAEKTTYAAMLGGQEAMSGLLAIVNASDEDFNNLTAAIAASDGTAQKMADTMNDNVQGAFTIMKSAAEGFGITVYESMQTPLKELCQEGTAYLEQLTDAFKKGGLPEAVEAAGGMFAEIAAKAAKAAPEMISAAVAFIQSFVKGISDNRTQLLSAARDIVYALVDGLVSLLPREVQKPVKETVSILKKSFEHGGLREAINTVGTVLKNLGKTVTNIAKVILPPLAKAIDVVGKNAKILIPLVTGVAVAFKAYSIVKQITGYMTALNAAVVTSKIAHSEEAIAVAAAKGALTLKQIAVGTLTGQIGLATTAQYLWNAAMNANPIGLVITAIAGAAGLIAALVLLCDNLDQAKSAEERLKEANEELGEAFSGIGEAAQHAFDGVDSAKGILDGFNDSILLSKEKQQELADEMDSVQAEISEIAKRASEERRAYTADELKRLDELFTEMHKIADQQLDFYQKKQNAVKTAAETEAAALDTSLAKYQEFADNVLKSAEETKDASIAAAEERYQDEIILAEQACTENGILDERRKNEMIKAARERKKAAVAEAESMYAETLKVVNKGYFDRSEATQRFLGASVRYNLEYEQEMRRFNAEVDTILNDGSLSAMAKYDAHEAAKRKHNSVEAQLKEEYLANLDEQAQEEIGVWLGRLEAVVKYGGEIDEENKRYLAEFLAAYKKLPPEMQSCADEIMQAFNLEFRDGELYYKTGAQAGQKFIEGYNAQNVESSMHQSGANASASLAKGIRDNLYLVTNAAGEVAGAIDKNTKKTLEIRSPSRKQRRSGQNATEGLALGVTDKKDDVERASEQIADVPLTLSERLMARMRSVGASITDRFTAPVQIRTEQEVSLLSSAAQTEAQTDGATGGKPTQVVTHLHINGREFAVATTPYIEEEMAFE